MKQLICGRAQRLVVTLSIVMGCQAFPTRTRDVPDWLRHEWSIGQERASSRVTGAYSVQPEQFHFEAMPGPFDCGGILANGCYSSGTGKIRYNRRTPDVIKHEAGHAILNRLGHPDWRCYEHTC